MVAIRLDNEHNYWETSIGDDVKNELDSELIAQLNADYESAGGQKTRRNKRLQFVAVIAALLCVFVVAHRLIAVISLPSLEFIVRSKELSRDAAVQEMSRAVVEVSVGNSRGTGFNIDESGLIVTNYHVIDGRESIDVRFRSGKHYIGTVSAGFPDFDLATVTVDGENLAVLPTTLTEPQPGDAVTIIGNPLGYSQIVVEGELLGKTTIEGWDVPVFIIDAPIHQGNSGSPVIDVSGKVAAVIFASATTDTIDNNIGLAVPIRYIFDAD